MFGIPGKQAVTITDKAAAQISKLMAKDAIRACVLASKRAAALAWNTPWIT